MARWRPADGVHISLDDPRVAKMEAELQWGSSWCGNLLIVRVGDELLACRVEARKAAPGAVVPVYEEDLR